MSGGVGPTCDITLPKAELHEPEPPSGRRSFFTLRQLNSLAVVIVLSASGMVSSEEVGFVFFSIFYLHFISKVAFPATPRGGDAPSVFGGKAKSVLALHEAAGAVVGLFVPIAYIVHGVFEGDAEGVKAAAPHVFLLAAQIFVEGAARSGGFSLPIRVFVPVLFNSMRVLSIVEWVRSEVARGRVEMVGSRERLLVGKGVAVVNMVFWSLNLFGFLLPFYLPKALKIYYTKVKD